MAGYTLSYAPVEQIQGGAVDVRADLYALGATLYHLLSGKPPVDALARAVARLDGDPDPLPPLGDARPGLPPALCAVVMGALALRGADRPATAADLRDALRVAGLCDAPPPTPPPTRRSRRWALWAAAPALSLALAVGMVAVRAGAAPAPEPAAVTESAVPTARPSPSGTARPSPAPPALPVPQRATAQSPADGEPVDEPTAVPTATAIPTAATAATARPRPAATVRPRPAATTAPPPIPIIPGAS